MTGIMLHRNVFLELPLPNKINLVTLTACKKCNSSFSFDENVVKGLLALISSHPDLSPNSDHGSRARRAIARDARLKPSSNLIGRLKGIMK